jgi:hypothetical protein
MSNKEYQVRVRSQSRTAETIMVGNDGQDVSETNYWESEMAANGHFFVSINAGSIRLLLPPSMEWSLDEIKTGSYLILSYTKTDFELLFEDGSNSPFSLRSPIGNLDRNLGVKKRAGLKFSVWRTGCVKVLEMEARVREVNGIPCLKKW